MVWHAFLLNPKSFKHYCNTPNLKRLRQVPFPWLEIVRVPPANHS